MPDFSELLPPILIRDPFDQGKIIMTLQGEESAYYCPVCGNHLTWFDPIDEWNCMRCLNPTKNKEELE